MRRSGYFRSSRSSSSSETRRESIVGPLSHLRARAFERLLEARLVERLEQEVQRVDLERADGMFVVRGHEDDGRHVVAVEVLDDIEAVHAGHLHVEEHEVGLLALDRLDGARAVGALADDFDVGLLGEQSDACGRARALRRRRSGRGSCWGGGSSVGRREAGSRGETESPS